MFGRALRGPRRLVSRLPAPLLVRASELWHGESPVQSRVKQRLRTSLRSRRDGPLSGQTGPPTTGPHDRFSATDVLASNLALVVGLLEAAQVPHAVIEAGTMRRRVVAVTGDVASSARAALAAGHHDRTLHACAVSGDRPAGRAVPVRELAAHTRLANAPVLRLFQPQSGARALLGGPELGCDLEFWPLVDATEAATGSALPHGTAFPAGTAIAPRPNRWADHLTPDQRRPAVAQVDGREVHTYEGLLRPHLFDVQHPVDVVYTWVDGDDPAWAERKSQAWERTHPGSHHAFAANASRFASHDELRYSLRSLEMYAGWVRQVFLVTDDQVPTWLRRDHPRLRVVDHRELFGDAGVLPTFNSHAIESRLHHVEGLSEHYLYLNDDVFFGRPVAPELFFHGNGLARFFTTPSTIDLGLPSARDLPVASAAKASRALIEQAFGRTVTQKFQHVAHPQRRSVQLDLETQFADALARTAATQFRSPQDVSVAASLSHYYGYATGRAVPGELSYRYCEVSERRAPIKLQRLLRNRDADVFCLNEVDADGEVHRKAHEQAKRFLEQYFPLPSSFELPAGPPVHLRSA